VGTAPSQTPPPLGRGHPLPKPHPLGACGASTSPARSPTLDPPLITRDDPAAIDQIFVVHHLHSTPPLILIVLSRLDGGKQSATDMLPLKSLGVGVLHIVLIAPQRSSDVRLVDAVVLLIY